MAECSPVDAKAGGVRIKRRSSRTPPKAGIAAVIEVAAKPCAKVPVSTVVEEAAATPVPAIEAGAEIAETVVNAAVVADCPAPGAGVPEITVAAPSPPARCPQRLLVRGQNPGALHPVVLGTIPGPVAGRPDVAVTGALRLIVGRDGRRCNPRGDVAALRRDFLPVARLGIGIPVLLPIGIALLWVVLLRVALLLLGVALLLLRVALLLLGVALLRVRLLRVSRILRGCELTGRRETRKKCSAERHVAKSELHIHFASSAVVVACFVAAPPGPGDRSAFQPVPVPTT